MFVTAETSGTYNFRQITLSKSQSNACASQTITAAADFQATQTQTYNKRSGTDNLQNVFTSTCSEEVRDFFVLGTESNCPILSVKIGFISGVSLVDFSSDSDAGYLGSHLNQSNYVQFGSLNFNTTLVNTEPYGYYDTKEYEFFLTACIDTAESNCHSITYEYTFNICYESTLTTAIDAGETTTILYIPAPSGTPDTETWPNPGLFSSSDLDCPPRTFVAQ